MDWEGEGGWGDDKSKSKSIFSNLTFFPWVGEKVSSQI